MPLQPKNLQAAEVTANTITLIWDRPDESGDSIESYELYYNDSHFRQNVRISIKPPVETYVLENLTPNTVYHIHLAAKSSRAEGLPTPTIQVTTAPFGKTLTCDLTHRGTSHQAREP